MRQSWWAVEKYLTWKMLKEESNRMEEGDYISINGRDAIIATMNDGVLTARYLEDNDNVCSTCGKNPPFEYQGKLYKRCAECAWTAIVKLVGVPEEPGIYTKELREILEV